MSVASVPTATIAPATISAATASTAAISTAGFEYAEDNDGGTSTRRRRFSAYVRAAPPLEPPYDPPEAPGRPHLRVVGGPPRLEEPQPFEEQLPFDQPLARQSTLGDDFWGPQPTARRALPDPQPLARRFLQATLEALAGWRSTAQLQQWTSPMLYADLTRARRVPQPRRAAAPTVTSVHVSEPADGVAEVAAVIRRGSRFHAVAARLEGVDGQWRCVALQIG